MNRYSSLVYEASKNLKNINAFPKYGDDIRVIVVDPISKKMHECDGHCVNCRKGEILIFINSRGGSGNVPTPQI